jgi:hypothetical protein
MRSVAVDGVDQRIWKADIKKVDRSAVAAATSAAKAGNKHSALLHIVNASCSVRLLLSDRSLTYESSQFLPPDAIATVDTKKKSVRTKFGTTVRVNISIAPLSDVESSLVQNAQIEEKLDQVADQSYQLRQENEELRRLAASGYLNFVRMVDPLDFCCFVFILTLGDRAKAAKAMNMKERSFYARVASWATRGRAYKRLFELVKARKILGRKGVVPLGASLQSSGVHDESENPKTHAEVLQQIRAGKLDQNELPQHLQEILNALLEINKDNWKSIRDELVPLIKEILQ